MRKFRMVVSLIVTVGLCLVASPAQADLMPVTNASFEAAGGSGWHDYGTSTTAVPGWTYTQKSYWYPATGISTPTPTCDGTQDTFFQFSTSSGAWNWGRLVTTTSPGTIQANGTYTLTIGVMDPSGVTFATGWNAITLYAGGTKIAERNIFAADVTDGAWVDLSISFQTDASGNLAAVPDGVKDVALGTYVEGMAIDVGLFGQSASSGKMRVDFDNVRLDEAVVPIPEPATMMLLGLGGLGAFLKRRRK